jgi:predicted Zn-dependent protease
VLTINSIWANEYSLEEERELGRELSKEVEMTTTLVADPVITEYVDRLGQTIVRHAHAPSALHYQGNRFRRS